MTAKPGRRDDATATWRKQGTREEVTSATNGANQTVSYQYDKDGNTTQMTYPLSGTWTSKSVGYTYDNADQLTKITDFGNNNVNVTYDAEGNPASTTLPTTTSDSI